MDYKTGNALSEFKAEIKTLKSVRNHHNVVQLYGFCTKKNSPLCIVTEYISGGSLKYFLEKNPITTFNEGLKFAIDAAAGMTHLHSEGIVHCDLASRNLLVAVNGPTYTVKVADLGLARGDLKFRDYARFEDDAPIPVRWAAPELLMKHTATTASDVWSFGVVLYEIFEMAKPYYAIQKNAILIEEVCKRGLRLDRPTRVPITDELYALMRKCFAKNPTDRPTFEFIFKELDKMNTERSLPDANNSAQSLQSSLLSYVSLSDSSMEMNEGEDSGDYQLTN